MFLTFPLSSCFCLPIPCVPIPCAPIPCVPTPLDLTCLQCELGLVYDQPGHTLVNRWLVLTHPEEATPTVQGKPRPPWDYGIFLHTTVSTLHSIIRIVWGAALYTRLFNLFYLTDDLLDNKG